GGGKPVRGLFPLHIPQQPKQGSGKHVRHARGASRTRTGLPPVDFESTASAIPPLGPRGNFSPDAVRRNGGAALTSRLGFASSTRTSRVAPPSRLHSHPWHDIPTGPEPPHQVTAVIE